MSIKADFLTRRSAAQTTAINNRQWTFIDALRSHLSVNGGKVVTTLYIYTCSAARKPTNMKHCSIYLNTHDTVSMIHHYRRRKVD